MDISNISTTSSLDGLIAQYMTIERRPLEKLETTKSETQTTIAMFSDLKDKLSDLKSIADDFQETGSTSKFGNKTTSSADESVLTTSADGDAVNGSHLIKVTQLAKEDTVVSSRFTATDTSIESTEGTGTKTFRITIDGTSTDINVDIGAGEDNDTILDNIAAAINDSNAEANASVIQDSQTTRKLILRSDETGSTYAISLTDVTGTLLATIGLDDSVAATDTTGGYMYDDSLLNSEFELDGISITNDSNAVEDVVPGVTLNLKGTQDAGDNPVKIIIEPDTETIKTNLEEFFEKYNDVVTYLKEKMAVDPDTQTRGPLAGDFTFINLRLNMRTILSSEVTSVDTGNPTRIADVGIEPGDDGTLSITNTDDFDDALESNVSKISDLFNSANGIAYQLYDLIEPFTKTGGIIDNNDSSLDLRVDYLNKRIESTEERLQWKEEYYRKQLSKLQEAFNALSIQQSIASIISDSMNQ